MAASPLLVPPPMPSRLLGMRVVLHPDMVTVPRPWRERLFSLLWRPFRATKLVPNPTIPRGEVIRMGMTLHMRAMDWADLKQRKRLAPV